MTTELAPVETVWAVLTAPEHAGRGSEGVRAEIDLRPGGAMVYHWPDFGTILLRLVAVEPPHFLSYRWARPTDAEPVAGNSTLVELTLTAEGTGTRLRVVESGIQSLDRTDEEKSAFLDDNTNGWIWLLDEVKTYAENIATRP